MKNPLAEDQPAVVDALGLLARHLRTYRMAQPDRIEVDRSSRRLRCQVVASPGWELTSLAVWADSLSGPSMTASRSAVGEPVVVVTVRGCTADGLPVEVFAVVPHRKGLFRALSPGRTYGLYRVELDRAALRTAGAALRRRGGGAR